MLRKCGIFWISSLIFWVCRILIISGEFQYFAIFIPFFSNLFIPYTELQLNRATSSDTEASFLDLNLCISNGTVFTKIYDKRDDFDFNIVNFPFLDGCEQIFITITLQYFHVINCVYLQ